MLLNTFFLDEWKEMGPISYLVPAIYIEVRDTLLFKIVLSTYLGNLTSYSAVMGRAANKGHGTGTKK